MSEPDSSQQANRWRRRFFVLLAFGLTGIVAFSFKEVRGLAIMPLVVHDEQAAGEIAYVMADGPAFWERLHAASDLYHWERIQAIYVLDEPRTDGYHFVEQRSKTRNERTIEYLESWGVPVDKIFRVPVDDSSYLSSRNEAVGLAKLPEKFEQIVVVTSPPHTRRCDLCFRRVFKDQARIQVYSARSAHQSVETFRPIGMEYFKLAVYWILA